MFILQLYSGQKTTLGDFVYRIAQPARGLSSLPDVEVLNLDLLAVNKSDALCEVPLLILHHLADPDLLPVIAKRKERGLPTIYELADHFRASQLHRAEARRTGPPDYHFTMEEMIRRCDAVQTTSQGLVERYQGLNARFFVFPNLVERVITKTTSREHEETLTVGWGGSARHIQDMQQIAPELTNWVVKHDEVRLALMASRSIQRLFRNVPAKKLMLNSPGTLQDYLTFVDSLDIGLAPLLKNEFNAGRSDVKFLEYASRGVVPLCARYGPYLNLAQEDQQLLLFEESNELIAKLETLRKNRLLRKEVAARAQCWVRENRLAQHEKWQERLGCYRSLFSPRCSLTVPSLEKDLRRPAGQAIDEAIGQRDKLAVVKQLQRTAKRFPDHYQVYYFMGWARSNIGEYQQAISPLEQALNLNPNSIRTGQLLARLLLISGKPGQALQVIENIRSLEPELPNLLYMKATCLLAQGKSAAATACLDRCLSTAPGFVDATVARAEIARAAEDWSKVEACAERLQNWAPDSAEGCWLLANVALHENDPSTARQYLTSALTKDPSHGKSKSLMARIELPPSREPLNDRTGVGRLVPS